ncbi:hypothetical protein WJX84_004118 [Apatococcus fuscideae]|uniref:AP2/ERF domain-containing protein n=1 Tax=Apatococcus fuscideae TaxID=2026836 RepID=A0AAW1TDR2_9CHLO
MGGRSGRARHGGILGSIIREAQESSYKPSPVFRYEELRPQIVQASNRHQESRYRGVRRQCWSTMQSAYLPAQQGQDEIPIGDFDDEEVAARAHDIVAVQQQQGAAQTNFPLEGYSLSELEASGTTLKDTLRNLDQLRSRPARHGSRYGLT